MPSRTVIVIYGEGGHKAQMDRVCQGLALKEKNVIEVSDSEKFLNINSYGYIFSSHRDKYKNSSIKTISSLCYNFFRAGCLILKYRPCAIISTGPSICIPFYVWGKLLKTKSIYIETWSRFYTRSITAKLAYYIVDHFYYQNEKQASLYPKGNYSGRL
ncbi:PssD/Cps14F family polysaccharide biosynthesis glycosyltransferase [Cobetia marina]|uniref:PssD/Cps14F family polysaccharide biosynthesis glycosyltransferase n=1 Tax=Cobetia marina TaxID=28258 RepID=A0ABU9GCA2_COBMA